MTFDDLEHRIGEDIMVLNTDPFAIATEASKLLKGLTQQHIFVVHRLAKNYAAAINFELALKDGDMVEVVRRQSAVLEPMLTWLQRHGVNSRLLRPGMRTKMSVGL